MGSRPPTCPQGMTDDDPLLGAYRATVRPLYGWIARRVGGDAGLAEDVTQECWLRAVAHWRHKGAPSDPLAWLTTVAANLVRNHFRRLRPRPLAGSDLDLAREDFEPETPDAAALLHWGLARLHSGQARLLAAYHLDGKRTAELAREHGLSERAVEGRLRRSREALRRHLAPYLETA